jgi:uncharacterized protein YndB with AHSA1/START domain
MDIHHQGLIRNISPVSVYAALTQPDDLGVWWGAQVITRPEVDSTLEMKFGGGQRVLKCDIVRLEEGKLVQWRVTQPVWQIDPGTEQIITWTLQPYETSTIVDLRMDGWPQDSESYAQTSYKLATFLFRLKVFLGDTREIDAIITLSQPPPNEEHI